MKLTKEMLKNALDEIADMLRFRLEKDHTGCYLYYTGETEFYDKDGLNGYINEYNIKITEETYNAIKEVMDR